MMKSNRADSDGDLVFWGYTDRQILDLAYDYRKLARLDSGDMMNLIQELARRYAESKPPTGP